MLDQCGGTALIYGLMLRRISAGNFYRLSGVEAVLGHQAPE